MKRKLTFIALLIAMCTLQQINSLAQDQTFIATYQLTPIIPDEVLNMEDLEMKSVYMKAYDEAKGRLTLVFNGGICGVSALPLKNKELTIEGQMASYSNLLTGELLQVRPIKDEDFIVSDTIHQLNWEIKPNDTLTILGYTCTKAVDSTKKLIAWFCPAIPIPVGPQGYAGLPGLVLKLEKRGFTCTLTSAEMSDVAIKMKKPKGDIINKEEYQKLYDKYIDPYMQKDEDGKATGVYMEKI